jgi:SAM-dependent methyltransferase
MTGINYYFAGLVFLSLAKIKYMLKGYSTPKGTPIDEIDKCIAYDISVVEHWLNYLENYTGSADYITNKACLELGPGSDFGNGLYLLAKGLQRYAALDVNNLNASTPYAFYEKMIEKLSAGEISADAGMLKKEVDACLKNQGQRIRYLVSPDFSPAGALEKNSIDIVFSQAAFEHFIDVDRVFRELSEVVKPGGVLVAEVDLKTHSRWVRDKDPNNIYRYSESIYNIFSFPGAPNRMRPFQYKELLAKYGWADIRIIPLQTIEGPAFNRQKDSYNSKYCNEEAQMELLTMMLCATNQG